MQFLNEEYAKRFFIDKVLLQAQKENITLSEAEKYMLNWTETEVGFEIDQILINKFNAETTNAAYEKKICSLLRHAYDNDVVNDSRMKETYRNAYRTLNKRDHYILVMIDEAIGSKLRKWGLF
jgi:hypothetical protein